MLSKLVVGHLRLAWDLAKRDLAVKYRRSVIGLFWIVLTPLCLLGIYSVIFGSVFGVSWQGHGTHGVVDAGFVLPFFAGLAVYLTFSDVANSSATLFASKRVFVVKSPFPIWVLWVANLARASVHAIILLALLLLVAAFQQRLGFSGLGWLAVAVVLICLFLGAFSLLLASLGPFIGDISEALRLFLRVLFYATPITYPVSLVPQPYRDWLWINPLACMVELLREAVVFGRGPSPWLLGGFAVATLVLAVVAAWLFGRVRGVIADVV